jgi:hypothetical protein
MMLGAKTVTAPAAAPTLSTVLLLTVPSVFFPTPCRFFAFFLGIEISFQPFGFGRKSKSLDVVVTFTRRVSLWSSRILIQLPHKGDQFERRGFSAETFE